tara:strand:+ start:70 stop:645 length:576 start_codon:yes stop_codon:yes gene_type:complete
MNCYEFQDKVSAYIEKELTLSDVNRFENHISSCKVCESTYSSVCLAIANLKRTKRVKVSKGFNDRLLQRLKNEKSNPINRIQHISGRKNFFGYQPKYAFASILLVGLIIFLSFEIFPEVQTREPIQLSTQRDLNGSFQAPNNYRADNQANLSVENSEEDSLEVPELTKENSAKSNPRDFPRKIKLVNDNKK